MIKSLQTYLTPFGQFSFIPQSELEAKIIKDVKWQEGIFYGRPRRGHPEGIVWLHIQEVLDNVEALRGRYSDDIIAKLRIITLIHDSFKYLENRSLGNTYHHASIASRFAIQYIKDKQILDIIQWHDEAYYAWRLGGWNEDWEGALQKFDLLINRVNPFLELYFLFFKCDTQTGDKDQTPLFWVADQLKDKLGFELDTSGFQRKEILV